MQVPAAARRLRSLLGLFGLLDCAPLDPVDLVVADEVAADGVERAAEHLQVFFRHALDLSDSALTRAPDSPALRFVSARARLALEPESDEALAQLESVHARLPFLEPVALALAHSLGLHDQADRARAIAERVARSTENEQIQQQAEEILQKLREAS